MSEYTPWSQQDEETDDGGTTPWSSGSGESLIGGRFSPSNLGIEPTDPDPEEGTKAAAFEEEVEDYIDQTTEAVEEEVSTSEDNSGILPWSSSGGGKTLVIRGDSGGGSYSVTVSGEVVDRSDVEGNDSVSNGRITGSLAQGYEDEYTFTGSVSNVNTPSGVVAEVDGKEVSSSSWGSPKVVEGIGNGWNLVAQTRGSDSRYAVVGMMDGVKYSITSTGKASPSPVPDAIAWHSSEQKARNAFQSHSTRGNPTSKAWNSPRKIGQTNGWYVYAQDRGKETRYVIAGTFSDGTKFLAASGRISSSPVFVADQEKVKDALTEARDSVNTGSQPSPTGSQPDPDALQRTRSATTSGASMGSTTYIVGGVLLLAVAAALLKGDFEWAR